MRTDRLLAALASLAIVLAPAAADAFCRTRSVPAPPNFSPPPGGPDCFEQGVPLYHLSQCVPYHLLAAESPEIPRAVLSNSLARAFDAWTSPNASCSPGVSAIELGPVTDAIVVDYKIGEHGHNVIGVVEGKWPHADDSETLALATLTFNADTGEVYDADLEIRSDVAWSFSETPPSTGYDLDSVLTHETGHFLGLSHSSVAGSVMAPTYAPGTTTSRKLGADDALGICAIYPNRQTRSTGTGLLASTSCDLSPGTPGTPSTCGDPVITHGCTVGAAPGHSATELARAGSCLALIGLVLTSARALRRRRATRHR